MPAPRAANAPSCSTRAQPEASSEARSVESSAASWQFVATKTSRRAAAPPPSEAVAAPVGAGGCGDTASACAMTRRATSVGRTCLPHIV
jgi:hypothetical protein